MYASVDKGTPGQINSKTNNNAIALGVSHIPYSSRYTCGILWLENNFKSTLDITLYIVGFLGGMMLLEGVHPFFFSATHKRIHLS